MFRKKKICLVIVEVTVNRPGIVGGSNRNSPNISRRSLRTQYKVH